MFDTAKHALNPYIKAGDSALPTLSSLLTPGSSATALESMPGFQFQSQWGNLAATNQLAAEGLGGSAGPVGKALSDYNQGLAGTYYMNSVNALQNFAGMGSGAAGALAGDAISSGNSQASTLQSAGNALASGSLGSGNALAGGLTGVGSSAMNALLLSSLTNANNGGTFGTSSLADKAQDTAQNWSDYG